MLITNIFQENCRHHFYFFTGLSMVPRRLLHAISKCSMAKDMLEEQGREARWPLRAESRVGGKCMPRRLTSFSGPQDKTFHYLACHTWHWSVAGFCGSTREERHPQFGEGWRNNNGEYLTRAIQCGLLAPPLFLSPVTPS